jgi:peptide/nickel transport system ATP-binding protein
MMKGIRPRVTDSFTSPRVRGEVGFYAKRKIRVRGALRESVSAESPPNPDPLPASGERELYRAPFGQEG